LDDWDGLADEAATGTCVWTNEIRDATGSHFAASHPPVVQPPLGSLPFAAAPMRASGGLPIVGMFLMVSCPYYRT
jgi:hypothetical protein